MFKLYLFQLHVVIREGSWRSLFQSPHLSHDSWRLLRPSRLKKVIFVLERIIFAQRAKRAGGANGNWKNQPFLQAAFFFEVWQPEVVIFGAAYNHGTVVGPGFLHVFCFSGSRCLGDASKMASVSISVSSAGVWLVILREVKQISILTKEWLGEKMDHH